MAMVFKPKKQQIHVPGYGVVQKEDFTQDHFNIVIKRARDRDAFLKQHFVIDSYGDLPMFEETEATRKAAEAEVKKAEKEKIKAEKEAAKLAKEKEKAEAEELEKLIAEEAANKTENASE